MEVAWVGNVMVDTLMVVNQPEVRAAATYDGPLDDTAERILDAAVTCFVRKGVRRTPMEAVAMEAGLARSSVYRYYRQKSDLIAAVMGRELQRFLEEFGRATVGLNDVSEAVAEGFVVTVRFIHNSEILGQLLVSDGEELLPFLTVRGGTIFDAARAFLVRQLSGYAGRPRDPAVLEQLAETAVRLAMSFVFNRESVIDLDDEETLRRYARRFVAPLMVAAAAE